MNNETKLLNCPFCGGEAEMEEHFEQWDGRYYEVTHISCRLCGCSSNTISEMECKDRKKRKEEAIEAWNARKPMERIIERLESESRFYNSASDSDQYIRNGIKKAIKIVKEEGGTNV